MTGYCTKCRALVKHKTVEKGYRCLSCNKIVTIESIKREIEYLK